jgi:hypothetical protein
MLTNGKDCPYVSRAGVKLKVETITEYKTKNKKHAWFNSLLNRQMQENVLIEETPLSIATSKPCRNM